MSMKQNFRSDSIKGLLDQLEEELHYLSSCSCVYNCSSMEYQCILKVLIQFPMLAQGM